MNNIKANTSLEQSLEELPFKPATESLKSVLRKKYLLKVAKWLRGKHEGSILPEEGGSNWESALAIIFFSDLREVYLEHDEEKDFCDKIPGVCAEVVRHLLGRKTVLSPSYVCWDKVTWDTAVVVRGILKILNSYPDKFGDECNEIMDAVTKAMCWLFMRFEHWETEVKYPYGSSDVAQILLTITYLKEHYPIEYQKIQKTYTFKSTTPIDREIFKYLIQVKEVETITIDNIEETIVSWDGDFFQTAETLDSLVTYHKTLDESNPDHKNVMDEIEDICKETFRFIEIRQREDGMWGTHVDTIRTLNAYIKASNIFEERVKLNAEPQLVFKALRWICDEKQCFSDGSFLHTSFLTIFMCDTLLEIHNSWPLAEYPIFRIYDEVFWASPVQTTSERTKRFAAEMDKKRLSDELKIAKDDIEKRHQWVWILSLTLVVFVAFILFSQLLGLVSISVNDLSNLLALASLAGLVYTTIFILIINLKRGKK